MRFRRATADSVDRLPPRAVTVLTGHEGASGPARREGNAQSHDGDSWGVTDEGESRITISGATTHTVKRPERLSQRLLVLALLAAVIVVDQVTKWWAWRHLPGACINTGGDLLTGATVGRWYTQPVPGALLDLLDFGLVSAAVCVLVRRQRPAAVTVCGSLMVGGWSSNLLDRLGMHYWTAPGSIRGAMDFINIGGYYYNLADFFIIGATPLFLLFAACLARRAAIRPTGAATPARSYSRAQAPIVALATTALIMIVALGAGHNGRLIRPAHADGNGANLGARSSLRTARLPVRPREEGRCSFRDSFSIRSRAASAPGSFTRARPMRTRAGPVIAVNVLGRGSPARGRRRPRRGRTPPELRRR